MPDIIITSYQQSTKVFISLTLWPLSKDLKNSAPLSTNVYGSGSQPLLLGPRKVPDCFIFWLAFGVLRNPNSGLNLLFHHFVAKKWKKEEKARHLIPNFILKHFCLHQNTRLVFYSQKKYFFSGKNTFYIEKGTNSTQPAFCAN